jgi:ubiquinone/menaquinone biosynthesis C-methylase UbiE
MPQTLPEKGISFSELYLTVRKKEGRIYSDEEASKLPNLRPQHLHFDEWLIRGRNCKKLLAYLKKKNRQLHILEAGCGNGWLAAQVSRIHSVSVTGLDLNTTELEQAKRVFRHIPNLHFEFGDVQSLESKENKFDIILFAASIQYFKSIREIISIAMQHLNENGEIHILDSHFYRPAELAAARERTRVYYESLGLPELTNHYFHHCLEDLQHMAYTKLHDPTSFLNRLLSDKNPFYWICVKKQ